MNSEYENKLQNTPAVSPMDKLKAASRTAVKTIEETPYQPIVYAIPKEDWNAFREWTKQAVTFQPTLYQQIAELTTKKESEAYTDEIWNEIRSWAEDVTGNVQKTAESIVPRVQTLLNQNKELLEQDGRMREQFISGLDLKETNRIKEFKNLLTGIADLIGDLSAMFDKRPAVEDCTTMPEHRERKKHDYEQSM